MIEDKDHTIVEPVPNVFTFVGQNGNDLRDVVMELNNQWSFYMVKRLGDDAQLDELNDKLGEIKEKGVDRGTMAAVESLNLGKLDDRYPVNSYTLKRSKTQQKVACEEVGKRILSVIRSAVEGMIKWVKERLSAVMNFFSKLMKKMKDEKRNEIIEKIKHYGYDFTYRPEDELKQDQKVTSHVEGMLEHYSKLDERVIHNQKMLSALTAAVRNPEPVFKHVDELLATFEKMAKAVTLGNPTTDFEIEPLKWQEFDQLVKPFNVEGSLKDQGLDVMNILRSEAEESATFDPYDFKELTKTIQKLMLDLNVDTSPLLFSDDNIERLEKMSVDVNKSLDVIDKLVDQVNSDYRDQESVRHIRDLGIKLVEAFSTLQFIGGLSMEFAKRSENWLKIIYLHLLNCRQNESVETERK